MVCFWDDNYRYERRPADGEEYWQFSTGGLRGLYSEEDYENGRKVCRLYFVRPIAGSGMLDWSVSQITTQISDDGGVAQISYDGFSW